MVDPDFLDACLGGNGKPPSPTRARPLCPPIVIAGRAFCIANLPWDRPEFHAQHRIFPASSPIFHHFGLIAKETPPAANFLRLAFAVTQPDPIIKRHSL